MIFVVFLWIECTATSTWRSCSPGAKASSPLHDAVSPLLFAVRAFALWALALAIDLPLPYKAHVASDFLVKIFSPLYSWNCCTSLRSVSASAVFSVYSERSSAKAWWFQSGAFLTLWEIPVESNRRRRDRKSVV